jgi:hypothetical protein
VGTKRDAFFYDLSAFIARLFHERPKKGLLERYRTGQRGGKDEPRERLFFLHARFLPSA